MDWSFKVTDVATIFATFLGPIAAVQAQKWLEGTREIISRRTTIFRVLMATRASRLAPAHVEALNAIPIEFYGKARELRAIITAWKSYLAHLSKDSDTMASPVWRPKSVELFFDLLQAMAAHLRYEFNRVELEQEFYAPRGHAEIESDQDKIRRGLALLLQGEQAIPMDIRGFPVNEEFAERQMQLQNFLIDWIKSGSPITLRSQGE